MDGWIDRKKQKDGWRDRKMDGYMDRHNRGIVGWTGKIERWLDGYKNGWMERKIDAWFDGYIILMYGQKKIGEQLEG